MNLQDLLNEYELLRSEINSLEKLSSELQMEIEELEK